VVASVIEVVVYIPALPADVEVFWATTALRPDHDFSDVLEVPAPLAHHYIGRHIPSWLMVYLLYIGYTTKWLKKNRRCGFLVFIIRLVRTNLFSTIIIIVDIPAIPAGIKIFRTAVSLSPYHKLTDMLEVWAALTLCRHRTCHHLLLLWLIVYLLYIGYTTKWLKKTQ